MTYSAYFVGRSITKRLKPELEPKLVKKGSLNHEIKVIIFKVF